MNQKISSSNRQFGNVFIIVLFWVLILIQIYSRIDYISGLTYPVSNKLFLLFQRILTGGSDISCSMTFECFFFKSLASLSKLLSLDSIGTLAASILFIFASIIISFGVYSYKKGGLLLLSGSLLIIISSNTILHTILTLPATALSFSFGVMSLLFFSDDYKSKKFNCVFTYSSGLITLAFSLILDPLIATFFYGIIALFYLHYDSSSSIRNTLYFVLFPIILVVVHIDDFHNIIEVFHQSYIYNSDHAFAYLFFKKFKNIEYGLIYFSSLALLIAQPFLGIRARSYMLFSILTILLTTLYFYSSYTSTTNFIIYRITSLVSFTLVFSLIFLQRDKNTANTSINRIFFLILPLIFYTLQNIFPFDRQFLTSELYYPKLNEADRYTHLLKYKPNPKANISKDMSTYSRYLNFYSDQEMSPLSHYISLENDLTTDCLILSEQPESIKESYSCIRLNNYSILKRSIYNLESNDKPIYIALEEPTFIYDSKDFINYIGKLNNKSRVLICKAEDSWLKVCPVSGSSEMYLKSAVNYSLPSIQAATTLTFINAAHDYIDIIFTNKVSSALVMDKQDPNSVDIIIPSAKNEIRYVKEDLQLPYKYKLQSLGSSDSKLSITSEKQLCGVSTAFEDNNVLRISFRPCIQKQYKILLDPGHGGIDKGACLESICEANLALSLAKLLGDKLKKEGFLIEYTRQDESKILLKDRMTLAENFSPDLFLSIHYDAWIESSYYKKPPSGVLCAYYHEFLSKAARTLCAQPQYGDIKTTRILKRSLYVLHSHQYPSVLLELGNLRNEEDYDILSKEYDLNKVAEELKNAIQIYFHSIN